jgi:c-di-AMP phosphodiesterase-like protein
MDGPVFAFILFLCFVGVFYYYQNYFSWISKMLSVGFAFLLLIIPQYVESIPNYLFYKTQMLNYDINESKLYNTRLTKNDEKIIVQNQNGECIWCKKKIRKYIIKSVDMLNPNLSNYYAICITCNRKKFTR